MSDNPAGWQPDPTGRHEHRYWDGSGWTDHVADRGEASTDAMDAPAVDPTVAQPGLGSAPTEAQPLVPESAPTQPVSPGSALPPPDAGGSSGKSARNLWIGAGVLGAVVLAVLLFLVFGGDDDDEGETTGDTTEVQEDESDDTTTTADDDTDTDTDDTTDDTGDTGDTDDTILPDVDEGELPELDEEALNGALDQLESSLGIELSDEQRDCLAENLFAEDGTPDLSDPVAIFQECDIDILGGEG